MKKNDDNLKKAAVASFVGSFIEWFDYASYGYMVTILAVIFFPGEDHITGLIAAYAVFALSFFIRPFGGIFWGWLGDRTGRRKALSYSIITMSVATTLIAFLPTYEEAGFISPLLLILARTAQGFSASGEYAGGAVFLYEYAPDNRKGFYTSLIPASTATGLLFGSLFVAGMYIALSTEALYSWGWRIPFFLAAPSGFIGWYIRTKVNDSPSFRKSVHSRKENISMKSLFRKQSRRIITGWGVSCLNAVAFYLLLSYLPTWLITYQGVPEKYSFMISTGILLLYIFMVILMGWVSDHLGRKSILLTASGCFIVFSLPFFMIINNNSGNLLLIAIVYCFLVIFLAMNDGTASCFLCDLFPVQFRYTGFAFSFNCANTLLGGTTPLMSTELIKLSGSPVSPVFFLIFSAVIALLSIILNRNLLREKNVPDNPGFSHKITE
ncbi:TPA: MFS transporter [Salmonella enterica subsp. enterica serovar Muenchen]